MPSTTSIFFGFGILGYILMLLFPVEVESNNNETQLVDALGKGNLGWAIVISFVILAIIAYISGNDESDPNGGAFSGFIAGLPGLIIGISYFKSAADSDGSQALGIGGWGLMIGGLFLVLGATGKSFRKSIADIS